MLKISGSLRSTPKILRLIQLALISHSLSLDYICGNSEGGMCVAQEQAAAIFMCRYLSKVLQQWISSDVYRPNELEVYCHKSTRRRLKAYLNVVASFLNWNWLGRSLL